MAEKATGRRGAGAAPVIIIRRDEGEEPPHHGGAWKVAYADFVTAMMAFFMLMWLLNATTEEQRIGLADYFAPTNLFGRSVSGSGKPFGGETPNAPGVSRSADGTPRTIPGRQPSQPDVQEADADLPAQPMPPAPPPLPKAADPQDGADAAFALNAEGLPVASNRPPGPDRQPLIKGGDYAAARLTPPSPSPQTPADPAADAQTQAQTPAQAQAQLGRDAAAADAEHERRALAQAGAEVLERVRRDPALKDVAGQLTIETVPEGLRIQVVDTERQPMFALGGAEPTARVRELVRRIVPALADLPNAISIAGHTDALAYRGQAKGNWELSADRANATRRILEEAGMADSRIRSVTGNADRDLLVPGDPLNPANRRISILVLRHAAVAPSAAPPAAGRPATQVTP